MSPVSQFVLSSLFSCEMRQDFFLSSCQTDKTRCDCDFVLKRFVFCEKETLETKSKGTQSGREDVVKKRRNRYFSETMMME